MFNKMQTDKDNMRKNFTTNKKQILRKIDLKFHKIAFYTYFVIKGVYVWNYKGMSCQRNHYGRSNGY